MIHDRALQAALAGGPILAELARHVEECPECRRELAELRALEEELRQSAPAVRFETTWQTRLATRGAPTDFPSRAWTSWAASFVLAVALLSTWLYMGSAAPSESAPQANSAVFAETSDSAPLQASLPALMWGGSYEDSTTALLDMVEPLAQEMPKTPPEAITNYLSPSESGGWNG
jgi:hypothetical protein